MSRSLVLAHRGEANGRELLNWLSSPENAAVRYLTARSLIRPELSAARLHSLRAELWRWPPLQKVLARQRPDGGFGKANKPLDARATLWALDLLQRCGLELSDEPVRNAVDYLTANHFSAGALSYSGGGSGVLPCYLGRGTATLIKLGGFELPLVQDSLAWLVAYQRFDHKRARAGGRQRWSYRAPANFGCWESVSCFHGVAGAFRALAAVPPERRSADLRARLDEALAYLHAHSLYKRSAGDRPLFRFMTTPFMIGDYRSGLLELLEGIADADPQLGREPWVRAALADMQALTRNGRVVLEKNYGRALMSPIPFEPIGQPSRFLTYRWLTVRSRLAARRDATISVRTAST